MNAKCMIKILVAISLVFCAKPVAYSQEEYDKTKTIKHVKEQKISLTLEQAIKLALKANRKLIGVGYSLKNRELSINSAESEFELKILPTVHAGVADHIESSGAGISLEKKLPFGARSSLFSSIGRSDDENTGEVGLSLDIPLLRGFGGEINKDPIMSSQFALRTAERSLYITKVSTVLETVTAVYNIIKQEALVKLFETATAQLDKHVKTARIKESVGLATPMDIFRAEIRIKDSENSLNLARESLRDAKDRLKLILSIPLEKTINVSAPLEYVATDINLNNAIAIAHNNRIELKQAEDVIKETIRRSAIAKNNLLPDLNLVMHYERYGSSDDFSRSMHLNEDRWGIRFVSATDFARTAENIAYKQSLTNIKAVCLNLEIKKDEIEREVRRQLESLRKAKDRVVIKKEQIRQAEGKLSLSKIKFNYDMASNFDVIEAETELARARSNLIAEQTEYIVGKYRVRATLGTLID